MKYLIAGKHGQLATAFIKKLTKDSSDFLAPEEAEFDITDSNKVMEICNSYKPDVIINCAAYNQVDKAEEEPDVAASVNTTGPKILAQAAEKHGAMLVHFGSDYVFDGTKLNGLYGESDSPCPINQYGKSKLEGEIAIQQETEKYLIFRLSWVYGEGQQNFIHKLLGWSKNNEFLKVACDEYSVPSSTVSIAAVTMKALEDGLTGLYHLTNSGYCSRYDWARQILKQANVEKFVRPVSMNIFDLPAKRPGFSAMSNKKISEKLGVGIPDWEDSLRYFMEEFKIG